MDVALRLSYHTLLLLSTGITSEVSVTQNKVWPGGSWAGITGSYAVKYLIYLIWLGCDYIGHQEK